MIATRHRTGCLALEHLAIGIDRAGNACRSKPVAVADRVVDRIALDHRQADVHRVAVEDPGEAAGDTTAWTPAALIAIGACSRELPQPKLRPPTITSPGWTVVAKSGRASMKHALPSASDRW